MYTEKDLGKLGLSVALDEEEDNQEKGLKWLLDMDLAEPEETLFALSEDEYQDVGLSAFEAEVAGRPLVRGNANGDDLSNYVDEEIVISSDNAVGDIYSSKGELAEAANSDTPRKEFMAISLGQGGADARITGSVDEGTDILGLAAEDDIGEKYVSLKRVKREAPLPTRAVDPGPVVEAVASEDSNAVEPASATELVAAKPGHEDQAVVANNPVLDEQPATDAAEPGELVLESTEGAGQTVPADENAIDYHDDFLTLEGFTESASSVLAPVIGEVMEEITAAVRVRLTALGVNADTVAVELRLGSDEASIAQCVAEGFQPLQSIYCELPEPLRGLDQAAQDAVYVRLLNTESNEPWNDLFSDEFSAHLTPEAETAQDVAGSLDKQETDWSQDEGFGEDIFGEDFNEEFSTQLDSSAGTETHDIEEAFSDLAQFDDADGESGIEAMDSVAAAEQTAADAGDQAEADAVVVSPEASAAVEDIAAFAEPEAEHEEEETVAAVAEAQPEVEAQLEPEEEPVAARTAQAGVVANAYPENFIPDYIEFNFTSQSNAEIFADFLDAFIEEGSVEIEKLEHEIGEWEKDVSNESMLSSVSRTLHTIKGIAKGVGLHRLGTLVHNFETLLEKMPRPEAGQEQDYFRVVNAWLDAVVRGVEHVTEERVDIDSELPVTPEKATGGEPVLEVVAQPEEEVVPAAEDTEEVSVAADETVAGAPEETEAAEQVEEVETVGTVTPKPEAISYALAKKRDKQLADEGAKALAAQQSVRITSEKLDHLLNLTSQVQQLGVRASQSTSRSKRSSAELHARLSSVRTHIRKIADRALLNVNAQPGRSTPDLDALEMDQYSELQEAANILREGVEDLTDLVDVLTRQNAQIEALLKQQSSVISSISSSIQGARVVPVSRLMPGLRRIVRTVSTDLGKVVTFQVLNETGALDRDYYARLQVILEHMVRNALDHGVESPQERVAIGKPTGGKITIDVRQSGGDYIIRLADDGRGIDPDLIRQSAYEKGLDIDVDNLTDDEAIRLIFHKGFSTARTLSEVSGRGVGMDIVLTELQQLGGDVQIQSKVGQGTAFEVRIPSNVSVNGALLVAAGGDSYAIPLNGLIAVEQVPVEEFFAAVENYQTLSLAGMDCEATYLGTLCQGVPLPDSGNWHAFVPVIIAGTEDRHMAIAIDNVEEALELVVRSLGAQFTAVPGVAGAATTAEGEAIVALDLNVLVGSAGEDGIAPVAVSQSKAAAPVALVVDDSRTQRMVATSQLESVGMETLTAENGLVAIDLLNGAHRLPDVILLDVEMPVKDGIETLREIRKSSRYGRLPVIMVTSRTGAKHRALASEAGCSAYMGKPFNFSALVKQINELTGLELQQS